jgi:succinate-semialdehyde dehydrogenase/glutarate-semialdehyde dehydrogenase
MSLAITQLTAPLFEQTRAAFQVKHPADQHVVGEVPNYGPAEARMMIERGVDAFERWRKVSPYTRSELLERWNTLILEHEAPLGRLMALEMGKPITEAKGEVKYAASFVKWYAQEAVRVHGERVQMRFDHKRGFVAYEPVGLVYAVTPWNFPAAMITRKAAPSLAAGCTMVVKPASHSPLTALYLAELWRQAGGPEDTLQILPSTQARAVTEPFMNDARVRKLTFTGGTDVGRTLYEQATKTLKRVSLELGGHAPFIVFEDADIERVAREVVLSKFRNAGQTCICTNRVYVQCAIADEFTEALGAATKALKVGDPLRDETQVGPLVDGNGLRKVSEQVADALERGAVVVAGGRVKDGLFFEPTVLANVQQDAKVMREETFGPVAPVMTFDSEAEAVRLANDSVYGLAAYAWTTHLPRAWRVAEALQYGIVGINDGVPTALSPQAPFGGVKDSGLGREGGWWGLEEYLDTKFISMGLV